MGVVRPPPIAKTLEFFIFLFLFFFCHEVAKPPLMGHEGGLTTPHGPREWFDHP